MKLIKSLFPKKEIVSRSEVDLKLDTSHPTNKQVLTYLGHFVEKNKPLIAGPGEVKDPYYEQGSHPEIVELLIAFDFPSHLLKQLKRPVCKHIRNGHMVEIWIQNVIWAKIGSLVAGNGKKSNGAIQSIST